MTCVLPTAPWHHFNDHLPWLPMNTDTAPSEHKPLSASQGYVSPSSDTRKSSTSSGKKRASRAGTRSVTTLSAAQLERKRANDREAQRAIRQRTKDHIDHLERSINDLRGSQEANEKMVHATQQRNRELEEENAYLRSKLGEAGFSVNLLHSDHQRPTEPPLLSIPSASPGTIGSSIQRPGSTSTPSSLSATTQNNSRHGSWQHPSAGFVGAANTPIGLPSGTAVGGVPNLTAWRSHENPQSLPDPMHGQSPSPYHQDQRVDWPGSTASYQQFVSQEHQRPQQFETAPPQQPGYTSSVQGFGASATPQPPAYHSQLTPQNEFSGIAVSSSPSSYQVPSQQSFQQSTSFSVTPIQVPSSGTEYTSPHGQMQPPPLPNSSFHSGHGDPSFTTSQSHQSVPYREEATSRSYSLGPYPAV